MGTQPVAFLAPCDPQGPGASAVSATGEADHEWEVEDLSPREAAVASCSGAALEAARRRRGRCGLRVVSSEPQLTRVPGPPPGVLGAQTQCLRCRRGWAKIETFESFFRGG